MISLLKWIAYFILIQASLSAFSLLYAAQNPNSTLQEAYKVRSSNPQKAKQLLNSLDKTNLSKTDQELYDYTAAYQNLANGDLLAAAEAYQAIASGEYSFKSRFQSNAALAAINAATQNWVDAFAAMDFLTENIDSVEDPEVKEQAHNAIINFYNSIDEKETVIKYGNSLIEGEHSTRFTCLLHMQLIVALVVSKDESLSEDRFAKALKFCEEAKEPIGLIAIYNHYATYLYDQGKIDAAYKVLQEHLDAVESTQYPPLLEEYYALMSKVFFLRNEYKKAQAYAYKVIGEDKDTGYAVISDIDAYEVLYKIAEKQQNYEQALTLHKAYAKAKSLNLSSMNTKMLSIHKAKQDNLIKSNQITLLDAENSLLKAKAQLTKEESHKRNLIYLVLFMVFLVVAFWLYKKRSHYMELEKISKKDGLTGIANRHFFTITAANFIQQAKQHNTPISLIIFDLDDFKHINDNHGHKTGDLALKRAITAAQKGCCAKSFIGRLGGEEFGIIMPGFNLKKALSVAQLCRKEIELTNQSKQQAFRLTASFGVACAPTQAYDFDTLFETADNALYKSKKLGKNQVNS
jgi:diguanylate cyclase (GGDEF)-like protein